MIIKNVEIILEDKIIKQGWLEITDNKITKISDNIDELIIPADFDFSGKKVLPGFIDCHVHGGYGVYFETGTIDALQKVAKNLVKEGVTKYCQASITSSISDLKKLLNIYATWMDDYNHGPQARQIGLHMEGPFISPAESGAHETKLLLIPNQADLETLINASANNIKIMTYAPEEATPEFVKTLEKYKILKSAGHSNISCAEFTEKGYDKTIHHVTHLFNGMSKMDNHRPGLATAALYYDNVLTELISDGHHVKKDLVKFIYKVKGPNGIILITDAVSPKGMPPGDYKLGNLDTVSFGNYIVLKEAQDILAGSALQYVEGYRLFKKWNYVSDLDMIKMTSINVAKQLNIFDQTGSIAIGKLADLVILDQATNKLNVTICEGKIAYNNLK